MTSGEAARPLQSPWPDWLRAVLVAVGYGTLALMAITATAKRWVGWEVPEGYIAVVAALVGLVLVAIAGAEQLRCFLGPKLRPLVDVLVLVVLVAWGLVYNSAARQNELDGAKLFIGYHALAEPEVFGFVGLHALTVLAYVVSRRRPGTLPGPAESLVQAFLIVGIILPTLLAVQLRGFVLLGVFPPLLPLAAPLLVILVYSEELVSRVRRPSAEAVVAAPAVLRDSVFRVGSPQMRLPAESRIHGRTLGWALATALVLLAGWALVQKVFLAWAPLQVFTHTYGHTLSRLPRPIVADLPD